MIAQHRIEAGIIVSRARSMAWEALISTDLELLPPRLRATVEAYNGAVDRCHSLSPLWRPHRATG